MEQKPCWRSQEAVQTDGAGSCFCARELGRTTVLCGHPGFCPQTQKQHQVWAGAQVLLPAESGDPDPHDQSHQTSALPERTHPSQPQTPPAFPEPRTVQLRLTLLPEGSPGPDIAFLRPQEDGRVSSRSQQTMANVEQTLSGE